MLITLGYILYGVAGLMLTQHKLQARNEELSSLVCELHNRTNTGRYESIRKISLN